MNRLPNILLTALLFAAILPETASTHEVGGRFTAPIPLKLLFGGAAVTIAITALLLALTVKETPLDTTGPSVAISPSVTTGIRIASRGLFFIAFVLTILVGFFGKQIPAENFATIFLWPVWLKGVAIISALLGSPWPVLSPWKTLYDGLTSLEGEPIAVLGEYPSWVGVWPALGGFLIWIGILENLTVVPRSPRLTALLITGYTVAMLIGGLAFGPQWFRQADVLAVFYQLFGRIAPVTFGSTASGGYRIQLRWPWQGCLRPVSGIAAAAFVIATVYTVSFDGFTSTPEFQTFLFTVRDALGLGYSVSILLYILGYAGFVAVFMVVSRLTQYLAGAQHAEGTAAVFAFAPTVLPIAVAYEIAHNYPFVISNAGQLVAVLWPFVGHGHGPSVDPLTWLSLSMYWWSQVLLIVVGHIVAVVAAHYVAMSRYPTIRAARRGHVPLTLLMIGYTVLSLWIISRPIVTS